MFNTTRFLALILVPALLMGCGKHATTGVGTGEIERMVDSTPLANTVVVNSKKPVGVQVNGRLYPKGEEPSALSYAKPGAPATGKGHAHVVVSLKGVTDFVGGIRLTLRAVGATESSKAAAGFTFTKAQLQGVSAETTLTNVAPGDYLVTEDRLDNVGGVFTQEHTTLVVVAGQTAEAVF